MHNIRDKEQENDLLDINNFIQTIEHDESRDIDFFTEEVQKQIEEIQEQLEEEDRLIQDIRQQISKEYMKQCNEYI